MTTEQTETRKLKAILSADVKGYSLLMASDEASTIKTLKEYRNIMSEIINDHSGNVVDMPGDNIMAEFSSVVNAVKSSVAIQKALKLKNNDLPHDKRLEFRIGINIGDVVQDGDSLYGEGVNIAARIEGLADPGGICISRGAYDHIRNKLKFGYEYIGEHTLKNIKNPVRVYKILMAPEDSGKLIGVAPKPLVKNWVWAIVMVAIIILTLIGYQVLQKFTAPEFEPASIEKMAFPLPDKPSIAVLPFDNMSSDPNQEYFSDGLTEEIITALSKIPKLFVIARNSTFTYKGKPVKIQQIAEELGVRYVLEGSVRKDKDNVRITAQLIDAITGHHLWAERYDRNLTDIFAVQDEITMKILSAMEVKLTDGEQTLVWKKGTDNLQIYLKLLQGIHLLRNANPENNLKAQQIFEDVISQQPDYAIACRSLALTHLSDVMLGTTKSPNESLRKAAELAKKSLSIDETQGQAYSILGYIMTLKKDWEQGVRLSYKAIEFGANHASTHNILGLMLCFAGRPEEAIPIIKKAIRLNPIAPADYLNAMAIAYRMVGKYDNAIKYLEKSTQQYPSHLFSHLNLSACYILSGREQEAFAEAKEILRLNPKFSLAQFAKTLPLKDQEEKKRFIGALRKAGLPDNLVAQLPDKPSIAVLPFVNMSNDPDQEYFSDGITDVLISSLAKIENLLVISKNSTFTYKGRPKKNQEIARELNVGYVLEGSVQKAGNKIRITAQLIDGKTDHHVWAETYDGEGTMDKVFKLQDQVTDKIVSALALKLSPREKEKLAEKGTQNLEAYDAYLRGVDHMRRFTPDDYVKAIEYFKEAVEFDSDYSQAYADLAYLYRKALLGGKKFWDAIGKDYITCRLLSLHYLELSMKKPTSKTYQVLASRELYKRNFNNALDFAKKAVNISPNDSDALYNYGWVLVHSGNPKEGITQYKKAIMLDPLHKSTGGIGSAYFNMGDYEQAVKYIEKELKDYPEKKALQGHLASSYAFLGNDIKAKKALDEYFS